MAKCSNFSEIEGKVSLKRRILPKGLENIVPLIESILYMKGSSKIKTTQFQLLRLLRF